jgi:trehalose 6-phosphate synthase/phosphatase
MRGEPLSATEPVGAAPLLILTNRLPYVLKRGPDGLERKPSAGGLVSAIEPVLQKRGGTWLGWPGLQLRKGERVQMRGAPYRIHDVSLSENELARYYHGLSNRALWPLFHSLPGRASFDRRDWPVYREVNKRFARLALRHLQGENDLVWIHDYHLMLAPSYLRRQVPQCRIAFFLHVPFPPFDIFRVLPWARELLRGLLACDLVGFHVPSYTRNFLDCVEQLLDARVDRRTGTVRCGERATRVAAFPIGIDYDAFRARAEAAPAKSPPREAIILGADRLDYTKGIPERILAVERLLEKRPEHRERVVLLQIAVPSRHQVAEYRALKREIEELVGRVNGRFGTATWSPIRYLCQLLDHDRLAGLYRDAQVGLVTPLRDGMNLVAKEFVASQTGDPGVLLLSRLAGAAETMREALFVNPYDVEKTADQIHLALKMPLEERRTRIAALQAREKRNDVHAWVASFLGAVPPRPPR